MAPVDMLTRAITLAGITPPEAGFWQSWIPWAIAIAVAVVLGAAVFLFVRYLRICLRMFTGTQMPMTAGIGNGVPLSGETHDFPSRDGTRLVGQFIEPPSGTPTRGTIIFAHEFNGDRNTAACYTAGLPELGFRIFTFDFRGHGSSGSTGAYQPMHWVTDHEVNDLLAAVGYVDSLIDEADHPLGVMGVSRGACAAAIAALHTPKIKALVLDGLFSTDIMAEALMKRWARIFSSISLVRKDLSPDAFGILRVFTIFYAELKLRCRYPLVRRTLPRIKSVPALFIYGEDDSYIDHEQRIKLYRAKPGLKALEMVARAKHNQAVVVDPEGYRQLVCDFLTQHIPSAEGREDAR
jgi:uncharacterized protein